MGLQIKVMKPIRKTDGNNEDAIYIYTLDFTPIKHLTKFDEGHYECKEIEAPDFRWSCGVYGTFRRNVCAMTLGISIESVWNDIKKYTDAPFVEFFNFADNEGCFDYAVAEKLHKDFSDYKDRAMKDLSSIYFEMYKAYMEILKIAAENKAVVYYL